MIRRLLTRAYQSRWLAWARPVWRGVRKGYYRAVNASGGARHRFGTTVVRLPAEYSRLWRARDAGYELSAVSRFELWCREHPTGTFLDVGCEIGQYALTALHLLGNGRVVAFDSALPALRVLQESSRAFSRGDRIQLVHGFVAADGLGTSLEVAARNTEIALAAVSPLADLDYVNLEHDTAASIPRNALDDLFRDALPAAPCLMKMDIEGAEAKALSGAKRLLGELRPHLLLSVHPEFLTNAGSSREEVLNLVRDAGYRADLLCVDHEEHWWCEPR